MAGGGIMSMFSNLMGSGNNAVPNTPAPGSVPNPATGTTGTLPTPGNIPSGTPTTGVTTPGAAPNGVLPAAGADGTNGTPTTTPFDTFKDLWKNDPVDPNAPAPGVFGTIDPKKFMEAAGKIDFSKSVTPEQLTAIAGGGEGAMAAFAQAMNKVAQGVYAQSAFATTKIVEQALSKSKEAFLAELPQHIKKQTVTDSLRAENPIFSNPAVQPIISALEAQMTVKYPNATAPEITAMAKTYVEALGISFAPKPVPNNATGNTGGKGSKGETDWSKFLE